MPIQSAVPDFFGGFKKHLKNDHSHFQITLGLSAIAIFLLTVSLAPFIGEKLGLLSFQKEKQSTFAQETCPREPDEQLGVKPDPERAKVVSESLEGATRGLSQKHLALKKTGDKKTLKELENLARERKKYLVETMRRNPDEALFAMLSSKERETFGTNNNCIESVVTVEGSIEITHADFFEDNVSVTQYTLVTDDNQRINIHPARGLKDFIESQTRVRVTGFRIDNDLLFDGLSSLSKPFIEGSGIDVIAQPGNPPVLGEQRVLMLLTNFQNTSQPNTTLNQANQTIVEMAQYYAETSYDVISVSGDAFGWYTLPSNQACGINMSQLIAAADPDVNFLNYKHLVVVAPFGNCGWAGIAVGKDTYSTADGSATLSLAYVHSNNIPGAPTAMWHEVGHLFSLGHAKFLNCGSVSIAASGCTFIEYGDLYDVMGSAGGKGHFNAPHKEQAGWLSSANLQTVSASGIYTIEPFETATGGIKALKIQHSASDFLYVEYRQPIGHDANLNTFAGTDVFQGALLHLVQFSFVPFLIDTSPPASNITPVLKSGAIFTDPATNTTIRTLSQDTNGLTVEVTLGNTDFSPPDISISSPVTDSEVSGTVEITASASDPSGVSKVEFFSNNNVLLGTDTNEPFSASLDTTHIPNGTLWLSAKAYDTLGNFAYSPAVPVIVANTDSVPPTAVLIAPLDGADVPGIVTVTADASDNVGVWKVEFWKDADASPYYIDTAMPYSVTFGGGGPTLSSNPHSLWVKAYDFVGNTAESPHIIVNPDSDGDGFINSIEQNSIGTNPSLACATADPGGPPSQTWPLDLKTGGSFNYNKVNVADLATFITPIRRLGTVTGDANFNKRWDLDANGKIDIVDMGKFTAGTTAYPPMFNGVKALGGPACTP